MKKIFWIITLLSAIFLGFWFGSNMAFDKTIYDDED
jgi:hypothetical protein